MKSGAEIAKGILEKSNGAPYIITEPHPESNLARIKLQWFVSCLDGAYYNVTVHAKSAWSDDHGKVWVASAHFGNTTDWVEDAYGEKEAAKAIDVDYSGLSMDEVQEKLKGFPWVTNRIKSYRQVLKENVLPLTSIELEMICDGEPGVGWFLFRGEVPWHPSKRFKTSFKETIEALRMAYKMTELEPAYRR